VMETADHESGIIVCALTRVGRLTGVYRHPVDFIPTSLMLGVLGLQGLLFLFVESWPWVLLGVLLLFPIQVNFAGMCHNHHHVAVFRSPLANRAFEVMMFLQLGMLPYGYTLHHNIGHHLHYMDQTRDPNRWREPDGRAMPPWRFAWLLFLNMYPNVIRIGREHPVVYRKFLRMFWVCMGVLALLFVIDPLNAFLVFVLPLPFALIVQAQATHYHHVGLESRDPLCASANALDPAYNRRTCNLGYHTAHHLKPGLHWAQLPRYHEAIADQIPQELIV
jgi:beta-carotene hydroxylase